jgi:3-oxoacyl-[acyl-carrier-protein] synthase II
MIQTAITGIGPVLACGQGLKALLAALEKGSPIDDYRVVPQGLEEFVPAKLSRRMDNFTRMAVLAACLAVKDACVEADEKFKSETGIVFGSALGPQNSSFSFLDSIMDGGDNCASSIAFTNSVHSTAAAQVAITLGIRGPVRTITAFAHTVGAAFASALNWITSRTVKRVLVILGEEISAVQQYSMANKETCGPIRPFSKECSYVPGEGCVAFMLEGAGQGYCTLCYLDLCLNVEAAADRSTNCDMLFSAAAGRADEFTAYSHLWSGQSRHGAYSPLYGSLFTGMGIELAIAALSLRRQSVFPIPGVLDSDKDCSKLTAGKDSLLNKVAVAAVTGLERITYAELGI